MPGDPSRRASVDGAFADRLQRAFEAAGGHGDVRVELWWRDREPGPPPDGVVDPLVTRARLLEAVYGRDAASGGSATAGHGAVRGGTAGSAPPDAEPHAAARLARFEAHRHAQTDALAAALAQADGVRVPEFPLAVPPPGGPAKRPPLHPFLVGALVGALVVAVAVGLGLHAGSTPSANPDPAPEPAVAIGTTTTIDRFLLRDAQQGDLPLGFQPGYVDPFPGSSYRLLYDARPRADASVARWRVWVGVGTDESQLCIVAAFDASRGMTDCYPRQQLFDGEFTIASPVGVTPLAIELDHGAVRVNGRLISPAA